MMCVMMWLGVLLLCGVIRTEYKVINSGVELCGLAQSRGSKLLQRWLFSYYCMSWSILFLREICLWLHLSLSPNQILFPQDSSYAGKVNSFTSMHWYRLKSYFIRIKRNLPRAIFCELPCSCTTIRPFCYKILFNRFWPIMFKNSTALWFKAMQSRSCGNNSSHLSYHNSSYLAKQVWEFLSCQLREEILHTQYKSCNFFVSHGIGSVSLPVAQWSAWIV